MNRRPAACALGVLAAMVCADPVPAGQASNDGPEVGLDDLAARLGAGNIPTGAGVGVAQVEFPDADGDYGPNQALNQFDRLLAVLGFADDFNVAGFLE